MLLLQLHHDISRLSSSSQRRRPWPSIIRVVLVLPACLFVNLVPWRQPSSSSSLSPSPGHLRRRMMKVCINFGDIRCVVPVGDGSLAVKEVIDLAVERFRKATSKVSTALLGISQHSKTQFVHSTSPHFTVYSLFSRGRIHCHFIITITASLRCKHHQPAEQCTLFLSVSENRLLYRTVR